MAELDERETFVFSIEAVLRSIRKLEASKIHEHFPGYIAILRGIKAAEYGDLARLKSIKEVHDRHLSVENTSSRLIYIRPFASRGTPKLVEFNANVAGSYAASSIRADAPLGKVIEVEGAGGNTAYRLRHGHIDLALQHLLYGNKVPIGALAAFFYRDYGFHLAGREVSRVIDLFREEFALSPTAPDEQKVFDTLFYDDAESFQEDDLELWTGGASVDG